MGEYERAQVDARFGMIMAENMLDDSVFMFHYGRMEARANAAEATDDDSRPAG
jgi:hypothetical protein